MDSQRETRTIRGISTILDKLLIVYPQMTVSMLKVFITVCQYPGLSLSDYCGKNWYGTKYGIKTFTSFRSKD